MRITKVNDIKLKDIELLATHARTTCNYCVKLCNLIKKLANPSPSEGKKAILKHIPSTMVRCQAFQ